jgi:multidrug efflux pump subunit AcrB
MWIVRLALRRPYTFVIVALLIVLLGAVSIVRTPTDIFPEVSIPVVSVIWSLTGLSVTDMEARVITTTERAFTTSVNDIEHIESQTMPGVGVIKVFFHPNAQISAAVAQVTSISQTLLRTMPPGTTPPLILQYSASSVPILQLSVGSTTLTEGQLFDYAQNFIRTQLATVQGASVTLPYGGKPRQVMVDLDPKALQGKGLSASDVVNAVTAQNLVLPSGTAKIGSREYPVLLNSSPDTIAALNDLPIKQVNGSVVYVRDVAQVHDGVAVQQNIVASDGQRSSLLSILKGQGASTLAIVQRVKAALPAIQATLPPELQLTPLFDQSIFVRAALNGVVREAAIAAVLTGLMILVFLGSWRSTLIVAVSIPLSILTSLIVLGFLGYTINIMTLGGLGLAVGILVDDATVELENVHRNLGLGTALRQAILDGAQQIATPAFVSTLSICIVFVPVVFLTGIVRFLFTPLALAVVFAMLASYFLSRTLVPTMVHYMLGSEVARYAPGTSHHARGDMFWRVHEAFNTWFERFRARYRDGLAWALDRRALVLVAFGGFFAVSLVVAVFTGQDFFPQVDAGQFRLHVRAPASTRLEATDQLFNRVEDRIRKTIPPDQIGLVLRNVGLPVGGVNLAFSDSGTIGSSDGEILVSLKAALQRAAAPVIPTVTVMTPSRAPAATDFTLPGSIQAIQDVPIFARADGYLKRRLVDIGDRVQQGQVLAEIDTPDLDQQVVQGRAALAQAQASLAQAQSALQQARATLQHNEATARVNGITLERWRELKRRAGGPAGRRQLPGRVRRQPRRCGGRPGEHRGARGQRERRAGQCRGLRSQPSPRHRPSVVPDAARAVHGDRHRAQRRPGSPDLVWQRPERDARVSSGADRQPARLRQRAADVRDVDRAGARHRDARARAPRSDLQGQRVQHGGSPRSRFAHAPHGDPDAERRRRAPARDVRGREVPRDPDESAVPRSLDGGDHPLGSAAGGGRASRRRRALAAGPDRAGPGLEHRSHRRSR